MMANIIMLGFFTAITGAVSIDCRCKTPSPNRCPKGTEEKNIKAFGKGYDYGLAILKGRKKEGLWK